jgi:prophage tail gpP-like protein
MSDVTIRIKGKEWAGWSQVTILRSVDNIAGAFKLRFTDAFKDGMKANFSFGDVVTIAVNGYRVLTGYLDGIDYGYTDKENSVLLSGRDVTGQLVDCSYTGDATEWKNQSVSGLVSKLLAPFDIGLTIEDAATANAARRIETFKATEGEKVFALIAQLCIDNQLMPICLGDGRLTLAQGGSKRKMTDGIQLPGNAQSGQFSGSDTDRFSSYLVKGMGNGTAAKSLEAFISPFGEYSDDIVVLPRHLVVFPETPADAGQCQARAEWEARYAAGMSRRFTYGLTSWTQKDGKPWDIHSLVQVQDKLMNLNTELYIREIEYTRNGEEELTKVSCVFPFTYSLSGKILKTEFDA